MLSASDTIYIYIHIYIYIIYICRYNMAQYQEKISSDSNLLMETLVQSLCRFQATYCIYDAAVPSLLKCLTVLFSALKSCSTLTFLISQNLSMALKNHKIREV